MTCEACSGGAPWKCSPTEAQAALDLAAKGKLPVGTDALGVDIVKLARKVNAQDLYQAIHDKPDINVPSFGV